MPTHFHFLIKIITNEDLKIQKGIGLLLSSYTKAINKRHSRHGSLFQPHTKAKEITDEQYLITLVSYIHQNPVRAEIADRPSGWNYSSYCEISGANERSIVTTEFYKQYFRTADEFKRYSEEIVGEIKKEYWI